MFKVIAFEDDWVLIDGDFGDNVDGDSGENREDEGKVIDEFVVRPVRRSYLEALRS